MIPITSFFALIIVLLGAVCISSGYVLVKALNRLRTALNRLRTAWKNKKKGESA